MAASSSGVGEGILADKEVELAGVQSSEREIDRPQQGGKRLSNHREIPICSFFVWQTWCQVLKVYHVPLLHSHPRSRDHHLHVRDGKQCCFIPSPHAAVPRRLGWVYYIPGTGQGAWCTFSAQIRGKDCELHFTDEAAAWQGVLTSLSFPKLGVPHPHAVRGH